MEPSHHNDLNRRIALKDEDRSAIVDRASTGCLGLVIFGLVLPAFGAAAWWLTDILARIGLI